MKQLIYMLLFVSPFFIKAQETTKKTETPQVITKIKANKTINLETKGLRFIKVIEDSRCPSGVDCIWAGQAKVLIGIYENDILLEEKTIIIGADGITPSTPEELLAAGTKKIIGYNLGPYPSNNSTFPISEYYLEVVVK